MKYILIPSFIILALVISIYLYAILHTEHKISDSEIIQNTVDRLCESGGGIIQLENRTYYLDQTISLDCRRPGELKGPATLVGF